MGGKGSGGRRPGAGRKKKPAHLRLIDGGADHRPRLGSAEAAPLRPESCPEPPCALPAAELAVWQQWAPLAHRERTLTASTVWAFAALCEMEVDRRQTRAKYAGAQRPLLQVSESELSARREHRALLKEVRMSMKDFKIAPFGKELFEADDSSLVADDPLAAFIRRRPRD